MRGKLIECLRHNLDTRIIPAHAGQTSRWKNRCRSGPDHPRACGANSGVAPVSAASVGSSPRMRGKLVRGTLPCGVVRIIPAHAGQTSLLTTSVLETTDHPRACGANSHSSFISQYVNGSSPRMRGKLRVRFGGVVGARIIPAHAGQTQTVALLAGRRSDHPRACGANTGCRSWRNSDAGSSPRMRGKLNIFGNAGQCERIIPAHAGQTPCRHNSWR